MTSMASQTGKTCASTWAAQSAKSWTSTEGSGHGIKSEELKIADERRSINVVWSEACAQLDRLTPTQTWNEMRHGAVLIDTRTPDNCKLNGVVPGAYHIPRAVLE